MVCDAWLSSRGLYVSACPQNAGFYAAVTSAKRSRLQQAPSSGAGYSILLTWTTIPSIPWTHGRCARQRPHDLRQQSTAQILCAAQPNADAAQPEAGGRARLAQQPSRLFHPPSPGVDFPGFHPHAEACPFEPGAVFGAGHRQRQSRAVASGACRNTGNRTGTAGAAPASAAIARPGRTIALKRGRTPPCVGADARGEG